MNIGVLASHEGTTLQSLLDACSSSRIQGRVAVVVSNNGDSGALKRARHAGVQAVHLSTKKEFVVETFEQIAKGDIRLVGGAR